MFMMAPESPYLSVAYPGTDQEMLRFPPGKICPPPEPPAGTANRLPQRMGR
jgi:hypothetical protein